MTRIRLTPTEKADLICTLTQAYRRAAEALRFERSFLDELSPSDPAFDQQEQRISDLEAYCDDFEVWLDEFIAEPLQDGCVCEVDLNGAWSVMTDFERLAWQSRMLAPAFLTLENVVQQMGRRVLLD